jgi:hypothetical protein
MSSQIGHENGGITSVMSLHNSSRMLFLAAWPMNVAALVFLVKHCYDTRYMSQKSLLVSKIGIFAGILMSMPYNWDKKLLRAKLCLSAVLYLLVILLLIDGVMHGKDSPKSGSGSGKAPNTHHSHVSGTGIFESHCD